MSVPKVELFERTYEKIGQVVHEIFSSILNMDLETLNTEVGREQSPPRHILGLVALNDTISQGSLSIGFPSETALQIFSAFYGEKIEQIDSRVLEGVGEVTNIVYGCLKKHLNSEGSDFQMFIPVIAVGGNFDAFKNITSKTSMTIHFSCQYGKFWVELNLKYRRSARARVG